MRWIILACLFPVAALAQDFGAPPQADIEEVHACVSEQITLGPDALVSRAARECIGRSVQFCEGDVVVCTATEQSYWEWRIARTYDGLQAWVADSADVAASVQRSVANPRSATANVPLECQLRVAGGQSGEADPVAMATCMLRETALIALELEFSVRQACETATGGAFAAYCGRE